MIVIVHSFPKASVQAGLFVEKNDCKIRRSARTAVTGDSQFFFGQS